MMTASPLVTVLLPCKPVLDHKLFNAVVMPDITGDKCQPLFKGGCRYDDVCIGKRSTFQFKRRLDFAEPAHGAP